MKKIFLISFFLVSTISANEDIWKPTGDYFLDCSRTEGHGDAIGTYDVLRKSYAHYDSNKDKKFITELYKKRGDGFNYYLYTSVRINSNKMNHRFAYQKRLYQDSGGEMQEKQYYGTDDTFDLDRENISMGNDWRRMHKCNIITRDEYQIAINNLEKERGTLIQNLVKKEKGKLKI